MCDKCTRRAIGLEIIAVQSKVDSLFKKVDANPEIYKNDFEFIRLLEQLAELLEKHERK
jgi:hypothetical protein